MNNADGEVTIFPLHDENSNYYADAQDLSHCTAAHLDASEGDWMMWEPHRWFKGVNDYLNSKHYACWSSNAAKPKDPECTIISLQDIQDAGNYRTNYKIMSGKETLSAVSLRFGAVEFVTALRICLASSTCSLKPARRLMTAARLANVS